ncbi:MAG: diguanylate cyclase [Gammaproteobacteria bacterium]|nr:MAG: diguanylate cyclase [Gammaproteobacteria bacterium]
MTDNPEQKDFAVNLLEHLVTATFVLDRDGKVAIWNKACERLTGIAAEEVIGTRDHWKAFYPKQRMCLADVLAQGRTSELGKLYAVHARPSIYGNGYNAENWSVLPRIGSRVYLAVDAGPVYDEQGELIAVVETVRDITEQKKAQSTLEVMAITDELTGLYNRRHFNEHLNQEWQRGIRSGEPLALILLDIDYFKQYNDHYGHIAGDECLKSVSASLQRSLLRCSDLAFRYGGEEFCVLLPNTDLDGAHRVAQRIRSAVARLNIPHDSSAIANSVTLSDGIASSIPSADCQPEQLTALADEALYEAKARGRNQSVKASI